MKPCVFRTFVFSIASFIVCIAPSLSFGQWLPDSGVNTRVCDTVGQQNAPQACTDGANGAIIVWEDARNGTNQIFAQHIDSSGKAMWSKNGVKLATNSVQNFYAQTNPIITTDDKGGAYVVWLDSRNASNGTCLFGQHILANGTLAYADTGLAVGIGLNSGCLNPALCNDGFGGALVVWEDNRASNKSAQPDIWMNRLWSGSVKYGLTNAGTGDLSSITVNEGTSGHPKYVTTFYFHDPNANFEPYLNNLFLTIPGKGSYQISAITNDTQLALKTHPSDTGIFAYSIGNLTGLVIDTMANKQSGPAIVNDGKGGCFLAWTTNFTSPNSIYGTHLDSTCKVLWDPAPQPGFKFYEDLNSANSSKNVSLNRDGNQLLLAWELTNSNNGSQEIYAQRMRCNTPLDTAFVWGTANQAVNATSNQILDQINPQIFGDDSSVLGIGGALIPFMDAEPGSATDYYDIAMVRLFGDAQPLPAAGNGFWFFEQKPHMHNDFQAVKITDPSNGGANSGLITVWDDADPTGLTQDTMLYAQRIDRVGRKYFPTPGTRNTWGLAISGNSPTNKWTAKQPTLVPRTDGAIVAWTDFRSGTPAIYCQLILMSGSLWIPSDTSAPVLEVVSTTAPDNGNACNSQCTNLLAVDTGFLISGIDSIIPVGMTNMQLETSSFTKGAHSVSFSVCAIDSFLNGTGSVTVEDTALNTRTMNFTYCTIPDTSHPMVTWDTAALPRWLIVHISDSGAWEQGLKSIMVKDTMNCMLSSIGVKIPAGVGSFDDSTTILNPLLPARFQIEAFGVSGNASALYTFFYTPQGAGVNQTPADPISISVFPNPTNGDATVLLSGAPSAEVTVSDVLGRTVDQFHLAGSQEWQSSSLAPGTYIVRALIGDQVVCKRIIRE